MKGYIHVEDERDAYLKSLFINNGDEIVNQLNNVDFAYVKDDERWIGG